jgi:hypothetical protein
MGVSHAVFLHNHVPNLASGLCPSNVFTKLRWEERKYHDLHVWGCPVYVLEKAIADGNKLPCWKPRSIRCVNMGLSKKHASTVPLVLNPETGYITPQYHVVFDDWIATLQPLWMPSQILTHRIGPNCLATQSISSHLTKTTTTILQRKREWTPKLQRPSMRTKQELLPL